MLEETLRREEAGLQRDSCAKFVVELFLREGCDVITLLYIHYRAHVLSMRREIMKLEHGDMAI